MHFITFPVASTNIFPLSNSTQGGQLVTEFNLKSREMVATNPNVKYPIGPSFLHCKDDFKVKLLDDSDVADYDKNKTYAKGDYCRYEDDTYICKVAITEPEPFDIEHWVKTSVSTSILQIAPGRAVINGHYVETLAPMQVDLNLANAELRQNSKEELYGNLSIGIKSYFSTENTMTGAMLIENTDNMYVGVQLVITKRENFKTPEDCPAVTQQGDVTADIKLADFTYINGAISASSISPNPNVTRYIPSERIRDFDSLLDDKYVSSENLIPGKFYTFSGTSGSWCDSTDSLMVWDMDSKAIPEAEYHPVTDIAQFVRDSKGNVRFVIPHKKMDGNVFNNNGDKMVYPDRVIDFPTASYTSGASGIVTKEYTQEIKNLANAIKSYKQFTNGKQIAYWDTLTMDADGKYSHDFPQSLAKYNVGDYILVREDYTVSASEDEGSSPATMYVVLPGSISDLTYVATKPDGFRVAPAETLWGGDDHYEGEEEALQYIANFYQKKTQYHVDDYVAYDEGTYKCTADTKGEWNPECWEQVMEYNALTVFDFTSYKGNDDGDYFEIQFHTDDDTRVVTYYYEVSGNGPKTWSEALLLTGGTPLATEEQVGGFYNATTDAAYADAGYVYLDETGHLKLVDYELLRSGALAYQLGADFTVPGNQTLEYIQSYLDEAVNARVAFKTNAELTSTPTTIHVYIPLPEEEGVLNIYNLDSRFGTCVYLHFTADDKENKDFSNIVINISDCEKIRIDSSITTFANGPLINLYRSCLYYDAQVINYITLCDKHNRRTEDFTGFDNLTLWYARFTESDPDLIVNGMEISQPNIAMTTQEVTFWDETISDDNHYSYALRSITLSGSGKLIGCSLYVSNSTTKTRPVDATKHIIIGGNFVLPQGSALNYPLSSITSPVKVTGTFTTAYRPINDQVNWIVTETSFTAQTGTYDPTNGMGIGSISFNSNTMLIESTYVNVDVIDGWSPDSYHIFYGGTTV